MTREIKFRVWDKDSSQMFFIPSIQFGFLGCGEAEDGFPTFYGLRGHSFTDNGGHVFKKENMSISQYTGLKDKHGIEIYEGDILIFRPCYNESLGGQHGNAIFSVTFKDGAFLFGDQPADQEGADYWEIIGNIFENLELIKTEV